MPRFRILATVETANLVTFVRPIGALCPCLSETITEG
jgi:hypothetical protein